MKMLQTPRLRPLVVSRLKRNFNDLETAFLNVSRKRLKEIADDFLLKKALPVIQADDLSRVNSLDIDLKDWQAILFIYLRECRRAGRLTGITDGLELKQYREQQKKKKLLESGFTQITDDLIKDFVSALNFDNKKVAENFAVVPYDALRFYSDYALYLAGVAKVDLLNKAKQKIYSGLQNGLSVDNIAISISNVFTSFSQGRLNTIARTEISKAINQGRIEAFKSPALKGFIVAIQFTAILDGNICEYGICEKRNGLILSVDDPRLAANTPPLHYRCRCVLLPISSYDIVDEGLADKIGKGWNNIPSPFEGFGG